MIYRPVRERDPSRSSTRSLRAVENSGYDEAALTALSTADCSCIRPLIKTLVEELPPSGCRLSVSSLRAYGLERGLLDEHGAGARGGLTFAPEAGTQRMRDVVNKNVTEEQLLETAERVFSRGWTAMKLYFMIGLPTEEDEDVRGIVQTGTRARDVGRRHQAGAPKVTVSVSHPRAQAAHAVPVVRDGHAGARSSDKQALLREDRAPAAVAPAAHPRRGDERGSRASLARGDRRLADVIEQAYRERRALRLVGRAARAGDVWRRALRRRGVDPAAYPGHPAGRRRACPGITSTWASRRGSCSRSTARRCGTGSARPAARRSGSSCTTPTSKTPRPTTRKLVCYHCGVACDLTGMREERLGFLEALAPVNRAFAATLPVVGTGGPRRPGRYRPPQPGGAAQRWRLRYTKRGAAALLGHLDLVRELGRILRRASLLVWYTQGFHPKPDMSFGPALGLGAASLGEYVDVKLIDRPAPRSCSRDSRRPPHPVSTSRARRHSRRRTRGSPRSWTQPNTCWGSRARRCSAWAAPGRSSSGSPS